MTEDEGFTKTGIKMRSWIKQIRTSIRIRNKIIGMGSRPGPVPEP